MNTAPIRILLIDDDASFRKLLELRLRSIVGAEASFKQYASLAEASNAPSEGPWDLVVLDQHLSDGLGVDYLARTPFPNTNVLMLSSDSAPEIPGDAVRAGAAFFLSKIQIGEPLFKPLVLGLIERNRLSREINEFQRKQIEADTVRTLVATLKHEINNPLGVVMGAAFLVQQTGTLNEPQRKAAEMIEGSGQRIRDVVNKLSDLTEFEQTVKSGVFVYQVPGDPKWEEKK